MLLTLILIPIIGIIIIWLNLNKKDKKIGEREIGIISIIISLIWSIIIKILSNSIEGYIIIERYGKIINLGIDQLSLQLINLTNIIFIIGILAIWDKIKKESRKSYYITLLSLHVILIIVFLVIDILAFYIFFEASLIPMYILIGRYGNRERRKHASNILFIMTLAGSLFSLIGLLIIRSEIGTFDYITILNTGISEDRQWIIWLGLLLSFGVKTPIFPFHIWLPEAHTEANITGSIILAGILLKLSSYGFIRLSIGILPEASKYYTPLIYGISTISILYSSITTLRQIDLKKIIAYSSIGHMSLVNLGLFSNNIVGIEGGINLMIAHGIVSPGLFILVTMLYDRYHTRILKYYRGIIYIMPIYSINMLILTLANMGIPLSGNFIGELLILTGSFRLNPIITIIASIGIILSGGYSIWLYNRVINGKLTKYISTFTDEKSSELLKLSSGDMTRLEFNLILPLIFIIIILGINPSIYIDSKIVYIIMSLTY